MSPKGPGGAPGFFGNKKGRSAERAEKYGKMGGELGQFQVHVQF